MAFFVYNGNDDIICEIKDGVYIMKEENGDLKQQLIDNTCCIILSEKMKDMDTKQSAALELMEKTERLIHNLIEKFNMDHIAINLPPDSKHEMVSLLRKMLDTHQNICLYLVGETEIQGIRYGHDRESIEKGLFPFSDPPVCMENLPLCEKRMVDRSDHVFMVLPDEEEELQGAIKNILEYAKQQNKNIVKLNEKTLQVKAYSKR